MKSSRYSLPYLVRALIAMTVGITSIFVADKYLIPGFERLGPWVGGTPQLFWYALLAILCHGPMYVGFGLVCATAIQTFVLFSEYRISKRADRYPRHHMVVK